MDHSWIMMLILGMGGFASIITTIRFSIRSFFAGQRQRHVAILHMRIGRQIGSAALVADGQHARVDGWTSLAVLLGAVGNLLGFPLADPIIGILITLVILFIVKDS